MGKGGALTYGYILRMDVSEGVESDFHSILKKHIERNLLHVQKPPARVRMKKNCDKCLANFWTWWRFFTCKKERARPEKKKPMVTERDDFVSPISIETYMEYRAKLLTLSFERETPAFSRMLTVLEIFSFLLTSSGAVIAVPGIDLGTWVAITVALSTGVTSYIDFYQLRTERDTRNHSLSEFQNLLTWWESLSIIDKRTRTAKQKAVGTIENCVLNLCISRAGSVTNFTGDTEGGDEENESTKKEGVGGDDTKDKKQ